ncbi:MAG TPA: hypothetical protein VH186_35535 [Chloroflexia bacterium]|nr:hypothetical protein [Chloroflexia bacterium]
MEKLERQQALPQFGLDRFLRQDERTGRPTANKKFFGFVLFLFAIYFIDSLGFLRLIFTPQYMETTWQAPELGPHLFIGGVHVVGAIIAGVLYSELDEKALLLWIFGIFSLVHLIYLFEMRFSPEGNAPLAMPMLYALAVSLYTVLNFALYSDLSTPETASLNAALGAALSGFSATFISTALAVQWQLSGMELATHLSLVASLAMVFFLLAAGFAYWWARSASGKERDLP